MGAGVCTEFHMSMAFHLNMFLLQVTEYINFFFKDLFVSFGCGTSFLLFLFGSLHMPHIFIDVLALTILCSISSSRRIITFGV